MVCLFYKSQGGSSTRRRRTQAVLGVMRGMSAMLIRSPYRDCAVSFHGSRSSYEAVLGVTAFNLATWFVQRSLPFWEMLAPNAAANVNIPSIAKLDIKFTEDMQHRFDMNFRGIM